MEIIVLSIKRSTSSTRYYACGHKKGTIEQKMFTHCEEVFGKSLQANNKNKERMKTVFDCHNIKIKIKRIEKI